MKGLIVRFNRDELFAILKNMIPYVILVYQYDLEELSKRRKVSEHLMAAFLNRKALKQHLLQLEHLLTDKLLANKKNRIELRLSFDLALSFYHFMSSVKPTPDMNPWLIELIWKKRTEIESLLEDY